MVNIIVIDQHPIFRRGIHQVLKNSLLSFEMTGFASQAAFLGFYTGEIPDLFVVDFNSNIKEADLAFIKLIKKDYKAKCIIIFNKEALYSWTKLCSKIGAEGFLTKDSSPENIIECIGVVLGGKKFVCKKIYDSLVSRQLAGYAF